MLTSLTHLRIAEKIKFRIKDIDLDYLMAGSIAPDLGKLVNLSNNKDISKKATHFAKEKDGELHIDISDYYDKYLQPKKLIVRSDKTRSFYWGFYFHILADKLWFEKYFKQFKEQFQDREDFINLLTDGMYLLDFKYIEENNKSNIFKYFLNMNIKLESLEEFINEIISAEIIYEAIEKVKVFYSKDIIIDKENSLLDKRKFEEFINEATEICINTIYK